MGLTYALLIASTNSSSGRSKSRFASALVVDHTKENFSVANC